MIPEHSPTGKNEQAVAFIVARLSSSRLPAKQLRTIGDKSVLEWTLESLERSHQINQIVIATVDEEENLPLKEFAQDKGIPCFWYHGEVDHVTTRLRRAAEFYDADICLLISGDCPLLSARAIDEAILQFRSSPAADVVAFAELDKQSCMMEGVNIARTRAWQRADDLSVRPEQKEHQFPVIGQQAHLFSWLQVTLPREYYAHHHRMSVDTPADLEFMNTLHRHLEKLNLPFDLEHVLQLLREAPSLRKINQHVYQRQLIESNNRALFIVDAGGQYGMGHLVRCTELATRLVEDRGWAVTFLIDHSNAQRYLEAKGFRTEWGAFGRSVRGDSTKPTIPVETAGKDSSLVVIDIFDQRSPSTGWRHAMSGDQAVVAIGNSLSWAEECDLIILPGLSNITAKVNQPTHPDSPKILAGLEQLILRRAIFSQKPKAKDIDLLVYLHSPEFRNAVAAEAQKLSLNFVVLDEFSDKMPELIARSRYLLSGFGVSCYEALSLGTYPICIPHTKVNMCDALYFYDHLDLPPKIIQTPEQISATLSSLPKLDDIKLPVISDQGDAIIATMLSLVTQKLDLPGSGERQ